MAVTKQASPWFYSSASGGLTDTSNHAMVAGVTGQRQFISAIQFSQESATVSTEINILDGASTVIWRGYAPKGMTTTQPINFDPPLYSSAGNALNIACVTTASATLVSAQGFTDV